MQFLNTKRSDDQTKNARPKISPKISYPASLPLHKMSWNKFWGIIFYFHAKYIALSTFLFNFSTTIFLRIVSAETILFWILPYVLWPLITVHKCAETIQGRKLFKGGNYMRKYGILKADLVFSISNFFINKTYQVNN